MCRRCAFRMMRNVHVPLKSHVHNKLAKRLDSASFSYQVYHTVFECRENEGSERAKQCKKLRNFQLMDWVKSILSDTKGGKSKEIGRINFGKRK